ncbi:MAG: SagB/ThcOx family dehydrogenase [Myxococcota bacterium]|nr:SagB/ThcOx family dehydrogenase [Myxococcota bacterium]
MNRRSFLRAFAAALAWLPVRSLPAAAADAAVDIHRDTRNTRFGAIGRALARLGPVPGRAKPYREAPRITLPPRDGPRGLSLAEALRRASEPSDIGEGPLSLAEVARLLHHTNGVTGEMRWDGGRLDLRAAPSAGALYAGEVYLVAGRVEGLAPGVYNYAVRAHALVQLRAGARLEEVAAASEQPGAFGDAPAAVLLTNVFRRYTWRYANRGYRYALIDTGHIAENLRLAAASAGLTSRGALRFHDAALAALLGIDGRKEAVCAVYALGRRGEAAAPIAAAGSTRRLVERGHDAATRRLAAPAERYHERTNLVPAPSAGTSAPMRSQAAGPVPSARPLVSGSAPPMPVERAIRRRRSAMRLRQESMARPALDFVVAMAVDGAPEPFVGLDFVAHRVDGLPPGLYRVDSGSGRPTPRRAGDLADALVDVCTRQEKAGEAAVAFFMVGRIPQAAATRGERSYRELLFASGAMGERIYLAAESLGLAARNLAAFNDDDLNALLGLDGKSEAVLHLTVVGPGN